MSINIDLTNVEAASFGSGSIISEVGWHEATIIDAEEGQSSGNHPQVLVQFEAPAGQIRDYVTITEKSLPFVKARLEAVGLADRTKFPTSDLVGRRVGIYVGTKRDDPMRHEVKAWRASEGDVPADVSGLGGGSKSDADIPF